MKIEHTTPDKPEVIAIADKLRIDPDAVSGKLLRIWIWADQNSIDGADIPVTETFLDRLTHRKGFAAAMRDVGWLCGENGNLVFPGFGRHNGITAKARAETNRRVTKHRTGNDSVTLKPLQKPLPEKRREEKNEESVLSSSPPMADTLARGIDPLVSKIKSLRTAWQSPAVLTAKERTIFVSNREVFACFDDEDWNIQREYLAARLPDGNPGWQPRSLIQYLDNPSDVMGHARSWKAKQRPPARPQPKPLPPASEEDKAAMAEFLKEGLLKAKIA